MYEDTNEVDGEKDNDVGGNLLPLSEKSESMTTTLMMVWRHESKTPYEIATQVLKKKTNYVNVFIPQIM